MMMKKKVLSVIVALAMALSLLPATALAADGSITVHFDNSTAQWAYISVLYTTDSSDETFVGVPIVPGASSQIFDQTLPEEAVSVQFINHFADQPEELVPDGYQGTDWFAVVEGQTYTYTPAPQGGSADDIVILYTNDVHSYITEDITYSGVAALKASYENVLLVDAGDHIQGTAYGGMDDGETIIELMNAAGYDLATLGNHEFDYGQEGRIRVTDEWAAFPYVSCNFYHEEDGVPGETVLDAYKLFDVAGTKIAIVGITTPETFTSSAPSYFQDENGNYIYGIAGGTDGSALYGAVQTAVDAATGEGADYVIALGHLGIDASSAPYRSTDVIANTRGIDAFIDGHSHSTIPMQEEENADGDTVILTQTGSYLDAVGKLTITADGAITTELLTADSDELAALTPDAGVETIETAWADEVDALLGQVIGYAEVTFDNYDSENNRLVRKQSTNTGDFCADALYYLFDEMGLDVDVAVMNGGGVRNKAITGALTYLTCKEVHTFGNVACLLTVTGQQLLDALEWGTRSLKADGSAETGSFLHVSGLKFTLDLSYDSTVQSDDKDVWTGPPTGEYRVKDVEVLNNQTGEYEPLDPAASYNLAGYNYTLRDLGDGFAMFGDAVNVLDYVMEDYMVLANYIQSFPVDDATGLPTITEDAGYSDINGSGRITILAHTCLDEDQDHWCDICGEYGNALCIDEDDDHCCDICYSFMSALCTDEDDDHWCDICYNWATDCTDTAPHDNTCDICGEWTDCPDDDCDHLCDICGEVLGECEYLSYGHDDDSHWGVCYVCGAADESSDTPHEFDPAGASDDDYHWSRCVCGLEDVSTKAPHSFSSDWTAGDSTHYHLCTANDCGYVTGEDDHIDDDADGICDICEGGTDVSTYPIWVSGTQVTKLNFADVLGDGTVSYDPDTNLLTLQDAAITGGYVFDEDSVAGLYAEGDLDLLANGNCSVTAPDAAHRSIGIFTTGSLTFYGDGTLTAAGGDVTASADSGYGYAESIGITAAGWNSIYNACVIAIGGNVTAGSATAHSSGVYLETGVLALDYDGSLEATGSSASGASAYSFGITGNADTDDYLNISVSDGYLKAVGGQANGQLHAGSAGIYAHNGGLYVYENDATVILSGGDAAASGDAEEVYAFSNGIYLYAGSVSIDGGTVDISGGSWSGVHGDGDAVYLRSYEDEDGVSFGGHFSVNCGEIEKNPNGPGFIATNVTLTAENGSAIYVHMGIDVDSALTISVPDGGEVQGQGSQDEWDRWDHYTVVDENGDAAEHVEIGLATYSVTIQGLNSAYSAIVPAGWSLNEAYCDFCGVEDFSECLDLEKAGFVFRDFCTDDGSVFTFDDAVTSDITITARWDVIEMGGGDAAAAPAAPSDGSGSGSASCPAEVFTDLDTGAWYHDAVDYVLEKGVMQGVTSDKFNPGGGLSRQALWMILARMSGEQPADMSAAKDWAVANGISDGTNPVSIITRQQFVTMLWRWAKAQGMDVSVGEDTNILSYGDAFDISEYAIPAIQWACGAGIMNGYEDGTLRPLATATRAAAAKLLAGFLQSTGK